MPALVGTNDGLFDLNTLDQELIGHDVTALARDGATWWALVDGTAIWRRDGDWAHVGTLTDLTATCLLPTAAGLLIGTEKAHLLRLTERGPEPVAGFENAEGRAGWYTPWGGPPDVRSMAANGAIYVNVHVGGILRSPDGGATWRPTIDHHADVHQVIAGPFGALAACARGLAASADGVNYRIVDSGLHARYARAVAVAGGNVLLTVSDGPDGGHAAIYRAPLTIEAPFVKCTSRALPEWFDDNIDTACLAANGAIVVFGTPDGDVYYSDDGGTKWAQIGGEIGAIRCVALT
jgi:hypothetical protein